MKSKNPDQKDSVAKEESELESIKKLLKKKELQTSVLKKIIKHRKPSDK